MTFIFCSSFFPLSYLSPMTRPLLLLPATWGPPDRLTSQWGQDDSNRPFKWAEPLPFVLPSVSPRPLWGSARPTFLPRSFPSLSLEESPGTFRPSCFSVASPPSSPRVVEAGPGSLCLGREDEGAPLGCILDFFFWAPRD